MKIIMGTDIEGVAGVVSFEKQAYDTGKYYEQAKRLLTGEVNAAIDGLLDADVEDVLVFDGHGHGGISYEDLHPAARLLHGRPAAPRSRRSPLLEEYDACVMIGQHPMAGVASGTLNHTQSSQTIEYYKLNGREIGEIAQFALYHGAFGLPLVFLSGDSEACKEAEQLISGIVTAEVKVGMSRQSAISLSKERSRKLIRERIAEAVASHKKNPIPPLVWDGPFELEKRFLFTENADGFQNNALYERVDAKTVRRRSDSILDIIYG